MGLAVATAAADAGIGLTLLDIAYLAGGFGDPVGPVQQRFSDGTAAGLGGAGRAGCRTGIRVGVGIHSVRAVPVAELPRWSPRPATAGCCTCTCPSSRRRTPTALAATGRTPTQLLADAGAIGPRTAAVHATHLTDGDIEILGAARAFAVICPTTEADLADGLPAAGAARRRRRPAGAGR